MKNDGSVVPKLGALVPFRELHKHPNLQKLFPTHGAIAWGYRQHRREYIAGGAVYEIAGRLLAHPQRFERVTLEIGRSVLEKRHCEGTHPLWKS